jgi:23S rRNA (cytidine1920-2'-O)/16S rRNA (cytidine1409-2'-O)-methyltransferase
MDLIKARIMQYLYHKFCTKISAMQKERLDILLVKKGLCPTRSMAQRLVMAGDILVNDARANKPSDPVFLDAHIEIKNKPRFVSRGGEKLNAALEAFKLDDLKDYCCADVGASTGGFTDCLLQHGARKIYTIDVGKGELHWRLRNDPRVVVMEKTNARLLKQLPERIDLVTIDASFISLRILLPIVMGWFDAQKVMIIALIKPQFEAGRKEAIAGRGVIRDPAVHQRVLADMVAFTERLRLKVKGLIASPLVGPKGNREFLIYLGTGGRRLGNLEITLHRLAFQQ